MNNLKYEELASEILYDLICEDVEIDINSICNKMVEKLNYSSPAWIFKENPKIFNEAIRLAPLYGFRKLSILYDLFLLLSIYIYDQRFYLINRKEDKERTKEVSKETERFKE